MKTNLWLLGGLFFCSGLLAQQVTNAPPASQIEAAASAPAITNTTGGASAPKTAAAESPKKAKKSTAKKSATKKAPAKKPVVAAHELRTIPLKPGMATVVASNVNVRGQARLKSEVVTRITKGQEVTVLEEITLKDSGPEEPSAWAKILLPSNVHAWVSALYVDPATKAVKPRRLNLRSGPGENYSVIGQLEQGAITKELSAKGDWLEIEPPSGAYGFVAAQYLRQEAQPEVASTPSPATTTAAEPPATTTAATPPAEPPTTPTTPATVAETPAVAAPTSTTPSNVAPPPAAEPTTTASTPAVDSQGATNAAAAETTPASDEPPPPRIVLREGIVRGSSSIQAPSHFELYSPDSGKIINYLYTTSRDLDLSRFKGLRVIATGEEGLDERWRNTPVLTIQRIQVLE